MKDGLYYYAPKRVTWGVWRNHVCKESGCEYGEFIGEFKTKEEARDYVYTMNGWNAVKLQRQA